MSFAPSRLPAFFETGDIVYLVSGSPRLTVLSYGGERTLCCWYDWPTMHCHTRIFPTAVLRRADPKDQKAWHSPPANMAPENVIRSSRTNQLITDYPEAETTDELDVFPALTPEEIDSLSSEEPSAGSVFRAKANNLANFGQADPSQETPF